MLINNWLQVKENGLCCGKYKVNGLGKNGYQRLSLLNNGGGKIYVLGR